jgi:hypothetical protein
MSMIWGKYCKERTFYDAEIKCILHAKPESLKTRSIHVGITYIST